MDAGPVLAPARYAVVACSACRKPWVLETRHARVTCPSCSTPVESASRARLWQGDSAAEAQAAAAHHRAALAGGSAAVAALQPHRPEPRHDSPADAAAAQAAGIANKSARAEMVALWMTRLVGLVPHADLVDAMAKAGLPLDRAEKEVVRLLATDVMVEPRAGAYRVLDA
jgi:hypothetical protein